jgi:hypothetical protein
MLGAAGANLDIWACHESGVTEVADLLANAGSKKLRLRDVRRGNFVKDAESYYSAVLNLSLDNSEDRLARLADLLPPPKLHLVRYRGGQ